MDVFTPQNLQVSWAFLFIYLFTFLQTKEKSFGQNPFFMKIEFSN